MAIENFWQGKRILITGATGLVGGWLSEALIKKGAEIIFLIRDLDPNSLLVLKDTLRKGQVVQGSLEDGVSCERAIVEYGVDTVFHLAAQAIVETGLRSPLITFEANIRGSYLLFEACRRQKELVQRIVVASSDKAYGSSPHLPYTEKMPLAGRHPYDVSKSCADLLAVSYFHTYHLPIVIARCGNIFGGGDLHFSRIVPGTIRSLLKDETPVIRSNGLLTRDYIYVEDVVDAYLSLGEQLRREGVQGEAFNFGPNRPYSVKEMVAALQTLMGKTHLKPKILDQAHLEIKDQTLDSSKAKKILGWKPKYSLEEGLAKTIQWYKHYFICTSNVDFAPTP